MSVTYNRIHTVVNTCNNFSDKILGVKNKHQKITRVWIFGCTLLKMCTGNTQFVGHYGIKWVKMSKFNKNCKKNV